MSSIRHLPALVASVLGLGAAIAACSSRLPPYSSDWSSGSSGSAGSTDATTKGSCVGGEVCDGKCTDIATSPTHCGSCDNACAEGEQCSLGSCVHAGDAGACPPPLLFCGGECVDVTSDPKNCGTCGKSCNASEACAQGGCVVRCGAGSVNCAGECIEPNAAGRFCGASLGCGANGVGSAGVICPDQTSCFGGQCLADCGDGKAFCGGACVDVASDPANCGGCGNACGSGKVCSQRSCCPVGFVGCMGVCRDLLSDESACGACGVQCPSGTACVNGDCQ